MEHRKDEEEAGRKSETGMKASARNEKTEEKSGPSSHLSAMRRRDPYLPHPGRTNFPTWLVAVICAIFLIIIIIFGLIVLIIYLVFRPTIPRVDLPMASLNALYVDAGSFLNADLNLLLNFTNHNSRVHIKYQSITFEVYFLSTLISTGTIDPFPMESGESTIKNMEMVTSAVYLQPSDVKTLRYEVEANRVKFVVGGMFKTGFKLGRLRRVYRWTYWQCNLEFSDPPSGTLVSRSCR